MSFAHRWIAAVGFVAVTAATTALAQEPAPRRRPEAPFFERRPVDRFSYRVPRMTMRLSPRGGAARGELLLRSRERAMDRMHQLRAQRFVLEDRMRERQSLLRERTLQRQSDVRIRAMSRLHLRLERSRPLVMRRRFRTI